MIKSPEIKNVTDFNVADSVRRDIKVLMTKTRYTVVRHDAAALYTELSSQSLQKDSNDVSVLSATPTYNDDDHDFHLGKSKEHVQNLYEQY